MKKNKKITRNIISVVLSLMILLLAFGLIYNYTDLLPSDLLPDSISSNNYVKYNGKKISNDTEMIFAFDTVQTFECNSLDNYDIRIIPNIKDDKSFFYSVDDDFALYGYEDDFSECFSLERNDNSFTIKIDKSMQEILQVKYPGKNVVIPNDVNYGAACYYTLVILSNDAKTIISIDFTYSTAVESIVLNDVELRF